MSQQVFNKERSRGISRDMSPEAISHRLDILSDLRQFTKFLSTARKIERKAGIQSKESDLPGSGSK